MAARRTLAGLAALVVVAALGWWAFERSHFANREPAPAPSARTAGTRAGPAKQATGGTAAATPPEERSYLVDGLNAPSGNIHADLRIVNELFAAYRSAVHGMNPSGENVEITAALTGRNRLHFAFVPPDCPAVNSKGELCDRWGSPYFFHSLAGDRMEIRSAGPDKVLWTDDDEVLTP